MVSLSLSLPPSHSVITRSYSSIAPLTRSRSLIHCFSLPLHLLSLSLSHTHTHTHSLSPLQAVSISVSHSPPSHSWSLSLTRFSHSLSLIHSCPHSFALSLIVSLSLFVFLNHYRSHLLSLSLSLVVSMVVSLTVLSTPLPGHSLLSHTAYCLTDSSPLSLVVSPIRSLSHITEYFLLSVSLTHKLPVVLPLKRSPSLTLPPSHALSCSLTRCLSRADYLSDSLIF